MKKFYFVIFFLGFTLLAQAQQQGKGKESDYVADDSQVKLIKLFPNPAITEINFEFLKPVPKGLTLQIYNFIGKKVFENSNVPQKTTVLLDGTYLRGFYIYQLKDGSGRIVESGKFQVNK